MTDLYNDIRPYRDHEVSSVVDTLLSDNEFIDMLIALRGNPIAKWMPKKRAITRLMSCF